MVNPVSGQPAVISATVQEYKAQESRISKTENKNNITKVSEKTDDKYIVNNNDNGKNQNLENIKNADYSKLAEKLKQIIGDENLNFEFTIDKDTKKMIIRVINQETNEVVQQYPPEIALKIARIVSNSMNSTGQVTNAVI